MSPPLPVLSLPCQIRGLLLAGAISAMDYFVKQLFSPDPSNQTSSVNPIEGYGCVSGASTSTVQPVAPTSQQLCPLEQLRQIRFDKMVTSTNQSLVDRMVTLMPWQMRRHSDNWPRCHLCGIPRPHRL